MIASSIFIVEFSSVENIFLEIYKESSMVKCYNEEKYHLNDDYVFNNFIHEVVFGCYIFSSPPELHVRGRHVSDR